MKYVEKNRIAITSGNPANLSDCLFIPALLSQKMIGNCFFLKNDKKIKDQWTNKFVHATT
ncbi:MAG: hypothetical protein HUU07_09625 [Candidatus Brocadia sinica]|nr:hypothetical protein [Candidatus Brocadia sinica]